MVSPLIPALKRQVGLWVQGQPGLQIKFQDNQGYTDEPFLWGGGGGRKEGRRKEEEKKKVLNNQQPSDLIWHTSYPESHSSKWRAGGRAGGADLEEASWTYSYLISTVIYIHNMHKGQKLLHTMKCHMWLHLQVTCPFRKGLTHEKKHGLSLTKRKQTEVHVRK
jgi:hypothetical protein